LELSMTIRPRRSVLYMPGSNARALEKAKTLPADGVILDLEDAVAPDAKATARDQVAAAVKAGGFGRARFSSASTASIPPGLPTTEGRGAAAPDAILVPYRPANRADRRAALEPACEPPHPRLGDDRDAHGGVQCARHCGNRARLETPLRARARHQ
jgi:hypothetical protein